MESPEKNNSEVKIENNLEDFNEDNLDNQEHEFALLIFSNYDSDFEKS